MGVARTDAGERQLDAGLGFLCSELTKLAQSYPRSSNAPSQGLQTDRGRLSGRPVPAPRPLVDYVLGEELMEDRAHKPDEIDRATARFWNPRTLDEIMIEVPVITSWDDLDIPGLTDEESEAFAAALADE
jgi:hypothetical protein